jgi:DNA-binding Xre family transcriptional regulator
MRGRRKGLIHLKVREVAESRGVTRTQLSRRADVNYATVNAMWTNPKHDVSIKVLEKVSRVLGVDISELYVILPDDDSTE